MDIGGKSHASVCIIVAGTVQPVGPLSLLRNYLAKDEWKMWSDENLQTAPEFIKAREHAVSTSEPLTFSEI